MQFIKYGDSRYPKYYDFNIDKKGKPAGENDFITTIQKKKSEILFIKTTNFKIK